MSEARKKPDYHDVARPVWDLIERILGNPSDLPDGAPYSRTELLAFAPQTDAEGFSPNGLMRVSEGFISSPDYDGVFIRGLSLEILMIDEGYKEGFLGVDSLRFFQSANDGLVRLVTVPQPLADDPERMSYEAEFFSRVRL